MPLALHPVPTSSTGAAHPAAADFDPIAAATDLAARLHATAVERDRLGGHPARERELIRASGLLALSVPRAHGGDGADWLTIGNVVRIVARADSALAHLLGFHHLQVAGIALTGSAQQQRRLFTETVERDVFWGNAGNPLDRRLVATPTAGGYVLDGAKSFASGARGADWLTVCAWDPLAHGALTAVVPVRQQGIAELLGPFQLVVQQCEHVREGHQRFHRGVPGLRLQRLCQGVAFQRTVVGLRQPALGLYDLQRISNWYVDCGACLVRLGWL